MCAGCARVFELKNGVPIFLAEPVEMVAADHTSNALGAEYEQTLRDGHELVLHIGAGMTRQKYPNCVELERKLFRHTDVVGDAHTLPFRGDTFGVVLAFNVFEHLRDPMAAASEIRRVLKPGGRVAIHTAFLQPLHESPHHYYNATEFGVRQWFRDFEVERCHVSANFGPGMMLAFLSAAIISASAQAGVDADALAQVNQSTLGEWAALWKTKQTAPAAFTILQNLPPAAQSAIAAGFEVVARKP
jgi:predicted SAM-dependent methyltransferase